MDSILADVKWMYCPVYMDDIIVFLLTFAQHVRDIDNIDTDTPMQAYNYRADGYRLTTEESDLSFSRAEKPHLHVSRTINEVGTNDDPENATTLIGQNLQFNYDYSTLVGTMQDYLQSELERVVCSNH